MKRRLVLIGFVIAIVGIFLSIAFIGSRQGNITNGEVDLSTSDFNSYVVQLDGEWKFYWNKLLIASDLDKHESERIQVPSVWNNENREGEGVATYALRVVPNTQFHHLMLRIPHMSTAYKVFINDEEIGSSGKVSYQLSNIEAAYERQVITFNQPSKPYYIIFQIANKDYARGGFWYTAFIGSQELIKQMQYQHIIEESILLGALLILAVYHLLIYMYRRESLSTLYLALIYFIGCLRVGVTGENVFYEIFRFNQLNIMIRLEYITIILGPFIFVKFIEAMFSSYMKLYSSKTTWLLALICCITVLALPLKIFTGLLLYYEFVGLAVFSYGVYLIIMAVLNDEKNSRLILINLFMILLAFVLDALFHSNAIQLIEFPIFSIVGFGIAFVQSVILAKEYEEIDREKIKILDTKMKFLQAQIRPHFIQNTLNTVLALIHSDPEQAEEMLLDFSDYLRNSVTYTQKEMMIHIEEELKHIKNYINIEKIRYTNRVKVEIQFDRRSFMIPPLIIQPIIENSIKHNVEKNEKAITIWLTVKTEGGQHIITVEDNGCGFDPEKVTDGIGITNLKERIKNLYGQKIYIDSKVGRGTKIVISIPIHSNIANLDVL